MNEADRRTDPTRRRRRGLPRWAWITTGLLVAHAAAMVAAVVIATADPAFTSVPDYYRRAVAWDEVQDRRQRSDELGWSLDVAPSALGDRLVVEIAGPGGEAVEGVDGIVSAFHHTSTNRILDAPLVDRGGGVYFAYLDVGAVGAWQVTVEGRRSADEELFEEREVVVRQRRAGE